MYEFPWVIHFQNFQASLNWLRLKKMTFDLLEQKTFWIKGKNSDYKICLKLTFF